VDLAVDPRAGPLAGGSCNTASRYWSDKAMTKTRRYLPDEGRPPLGSPILGSMRAGANVIHRMVLSDQHTKTTERLKY